MNTSTDTELAELWGTRPNLSEADWGRFYGVVARALSGCNPSLLRELGLQKHSQVADFFAEKIWPRTTWHAAAPYGAGGLCRYFSRYLSDQLKSAAWQHQASHVGVELADEEKTAESTLGRFDEVLRVTGRTEAGLRQSAREFLVTLDEGAIRLTVHACDENAGALSKTASRLGIASYHYKALQLGITRKKGEFYAGYESSLIGKWLVKDLNIEIVPDNMQEIFVALKILCDEALSICGDTGE